MIPALATMSPLDLSWLEPDGAVASGFGGAILLAAIVIAAAAAAAAVVAVFRRDRLRHGPTVRRLCRGLGLRLDQRRLLERVARAADQPHAGGVLLSRGCFDAAARRYAARLGPEPRLADLRSRIFGASEDRQ